MLHATVRHVHNLTFQARGKSGHAVVLDGSASAGGDDCAPSPKEFLLFALGGCTAFDVALILRKRRLELRSFTVEMEADELDAAPRVFTEVRVTYRLDGPEIPAADVERAIRLSHEKYCSVGAMLLRALPIRWKAILNGEEIASGAESGAAAA